jgi:hypothetical protein
MKLMTHDFIGIIGHAKTPSPDSAAIFLLTHGVMFLDLNKIMKCT